MKTDELFEKLAKKFDTDQVVGAPLTPSLLKILMLLFTPDEAGRSETPLSKHHP